MSRRPRKWFKIGKHRALILLIDFELEVISACVESVMREDAYPCWTPNQDETLHEFFASVGDQHKSFPYNPHDLDNAHAAMKDAMQWTEDVIGPPVRRMALWKLYFRALMFWRYKPVWKGSRLIGLIPKSSGYTLDDFNKLQ